MAPVGPRAGSRGAAGRPRGGPVTAASGGRLATFSIAARDPVTGMLGVAVASKALAAGNICPFVRPRVGAVATQAWVNPFLAPRILDLLEGGVAPEVAAATALAEDRFSAYRQLNVVDAAGRSFTYTGEHTDPWRGGRHGPGYAIAGNILVSEATVAAMEDAFLTGRAANLGERLIAVLEAGQEAGGDARGRQSAAVKVMCQTVVPYLDLRVDDHPDPVAELRRIYELAAAGEGGELEFYARVSCDQHASENPEDYPE
ncbi:MAG TPA: DUF1028 domain-containing protein [Thermoleophilia bacterium]|nr:DUF1028 domain-containing protein [Acidobacteriota bacterium]HQG04457.1 DUF1028 domain-containing protein [Thermoleophilia bacterium]HQG55334.1 DUF1028 domain-containing protein [Thermoleophilia bacterium]HQJ98202.1 DUF1028 domain-containing protein [Thermoleophilia bacterium]